VRIYYITNDTFLFLISFFDKTPVNTKYNNTNIILLNVFI